MIQKKWLFLLIYLYNEKKVPLRHLNNHKGGLIWDTAIPYGILPYLRTLDEY